MKTTRAMLILLLTCALLLSGCVSISVGDRDGVRGNGKLAAESRPASGFDEIVLNGMGDVQIIHGEKEAVSVEAEENLLPYLTTEVSGGRLVIGIKPNTHLRPTKNIRFTVTVVELKGLELNGSGNLQADRVEAGTATANIDGSGNIAIAAMQVDRLEVTLRGSGNFTASGSARDQAIDVPGSGSFNGADLEGEVASVNIPGSGSVTVRVSNWLEVRISGSGTVSYYGNPDVDKDISGSGTVVQRGQ